MSFLVDHLLQSTVFAAAMGVATLALRGHGARTRHGLWLAASVKFLLPFSVLVGLGSRIEWRTPAPDSTPQRTFVMEEPPARVTSATPVLSAPPAPAPQKRAPNVLPAIWCCGFAVVAIRWAVRWRRVARSVRRARPLAFASNRLDDGKRVPVLGSEEMIEPGVFGVFRPVMVVPAGIAGQLSEAQMESVLAHELSHVRHRDNLTAAVHMLVEALFWFHPLVWWIGARMVEERERACDEDVVQLGGDPAVYAEGILRVCRLCLESPLPCVSGISSSGLKHRIERILTPRLVRQLDFGRKMLLAGMGVAAIAGPVGCGLAHGPRVRAQSQPRTAAAPLSFEIASIKPADQEILERRITRSGGRITWKTDLLNLIQYAYHIENWRVSGLPADPIYEYDATMDPSTTDDQVRLMLQTLLAERFKMRAHRVTETVDGYSLTVAKGGLKIKEARTDDPAAPWPVWERGAQPAMEGWVEAQLPEAGVEAFVARRATMRKFSETLQRILNVMVADDTGLAGTYYFAFRCGCYENGATDASGLAGALRQNLGLRLERRKGPVDMLAIDYIETRPTENAP